MQPVPTLRLPPPPKPPKPLHLTMSVKKIDQSARNERGAIPDWSQDEGTEKDDDDEEEGLPKWLLGPEASSLARPGDELTSITRRVHPKQRSTASTSSSATGSRWGSTAKRRRTLVGGKTTVRTSIYFDPHQPNPLVETSSTTSGSESTEDGSEEGPELELEAPRSALALHAFSGEAAFGELSFDAGSKLTIEIDDLGGNWALGYVGETNEGRGLIPRGWYAYTYNPNEEDDSAAEDEALESDEVQPTVAEPRPVQDPAATLCLPPSDSSDNTHIIGTSLSASPASSTASSPYLPPATVAVDSHSAAYGPDSSNGQSSDKDNRSRTSHLPKESLPKGFISPPIGAQTAASPEPIEPFSDPFPAQESDVVLPDQVKLRSFADVVKASHLVPSKLVDLHASRPSELLVDRSSPSSDPAEPSPTPSMLRSRSIKGNVVVSGIQFEPLVSTPGEGDSLAEWPWPDLAGGTVGELEKSMAEPNQDAIDAHVTHIDEEEETKARRWADVVQKADRESLGFALGAQIDEEEEPGNEEIDAMGRDRESTVTLSKTTILAEPETNAIRQEEALLPPMSEEPLVFTPRSLTRYPTPPPLSDDSLIAAAIEQTPRPTTIFDLISLNRDPSTRSAPVRRGRTAVEAWILSGTSATEEEDGYFIESGPTWRPSAEPFTVHVHSPSKRTSATRPAYTLFSLTTIFGHQDVATPLTVERRYSDFVAFATLLAGQYPLIVIPPLPDKTYAGRFAEAFVETRRRDLERWLCRIGRHPILRGADEVREFLSLESESDLRLLLTKPNIPNPGFWERISHPAFNLDSSDAEELVAQFDAHAQAVEVGRGVMAIEAEVGRVRTAWAGLAESLDAIAQTFSRLVAGRFLLPETTVDKVDEDNVQLDESIRSRRQAIKQRVQNEEGALTWKDSCEDSLATTKAVQATAEALGAVGELADALASNSLLPAQELLVELSHPKSQHVGLVQAHSTTLLLHRELSAAAQPADEAISRCETILNITSAEMDRAHTERNEDLRTVAQILLDSEISFHEMALEKLRFARSHLDPDALACLAQTGPRLRSRLEHAHTPRPPLPMPSNYSIPASVLGIGSTFVKPVSEALTMGVGGALGLTRSSSTSSVAPTRVNATAGTMSLSAAELLHMQGHGESGRRNTQGGSWRQSIFGGGTIW